MTREIFYGMEIFLLYAELPAKSCAWMLLLVQTNVETGGTDKRSDAGGLYAQNINLTERLAILPM